MPSAPVAGSNLRLLAVVFVQVVGDTNVPARSLTALTTTTTVSVMSVAADATPAATVRNLRRCDRDNEDQGLR
ncbi:unannotated protein [freshwater metagenome]|uniref:Unannotated protein n=1 Tax=freshwater metagenome TaxID=449393 RepID=A0A6J6SJ41_9ZZZZ